jgi:hypothetical protein
MEAVFRGALLKDRLAVAAGLARCQLAGNWSPGSTTAGR